MHKNRGALTNKEEPESSKTKDDLRFTQNYGELAPVALLGVCDAHTYGARVMRPFLPIRSTLPRGAHAFRLYCPDV
jgi:hypothetical protein